MKLRIEITMDNAAFEQYAGDELAAIFRNQCATIVGGLAKEDFQDWGHSLRDSNGNKVGSISVKGS